MAQDYNIYIHGDGGEGDSLNSKFVPFEVRQENGGSSIADKFMSGFQKFQKGVQTVSNLGKTALSVAAKALPWLQVILAVVKLADKAIAVGAEWAENYAGDYSHTVRYNNVKRSLSWVLNPFHNGIEVLKQTMEMNKQNTEKAELRKLIGSSTMRNRGVGV